MNQPPRPPPTPKRTIQGMPAGGVALPGSMPGVGLSKEASGSMTAPKSDEASGSMQVAAAEAPPSAGAMRPPQVSGYDAVKMTDLPSGDPAEMVIPLPPPVPDGDTGGLKVARLSMSGENVMPSPEVLAAAAGSDEAVPDIKTVPPPARQDPYIGVTIDGRYKVESVLGEGGMGVVYAGRHKVINKRVAIKVLRADLSRDREMTERFLQEARAASSIGHPHIVDVSDFGELPDGSAFFIMEFLEGRSLSSFMNEVKPVPQKRLSHIAKQVADALDAAHKQGIVHRDLKPDNVFLMNRGLEKDFVKILDFGIAKVASSGTAKLTRAGTVFGTPHYMSPEQAAGAPVDHRTDIYALGVIMYELAAGKVPFDADNYMGILTQHMYKAPVPIRVLVPPPSENISPGLEAIILKCLSKKPEQRYSAMSDLVEDLDRLDRGEMPTAVSEMIARSGSFNVPADYFANPAGLGNMVPGEPPSKRKPWGIIAGGAGVLVAVLLVAVILSRGSDGKANTVAPQTTPSAPVAGPTPTETASAAPSATQQTPPKPAGKPVAVIAEPIDAEVFQGTESLGKVPVTVNVADGEKVEVEVRKEGYATQTVSLDGKKPRVAVRLKLLPQGHGAKPAGGGQAPAVKTDVPQVKPRGGGDIVDPWGGKK